MVGTVKVQRERFFGVLPVLRIRQIAGLYHLRQHNVSPLRASFGIAHGVEVRRVLAQSDKRGRLGYGQVFGFLIKIGVGRGLYSHGIVQEVEVVKVKGDNLFFGVMAFQFHGNNPFDGLLQHTFDCRMRLLRIKLLGQLLCDGASTACTGVSHQSTFHKGAPKGDEVDARMVVETNVLRGHQSMNKVRRKGAIGYANAVFAVFVPCAYHLSVSRIHLRGKSVDGVLQFGYGRHVAYPTKPNGHESQYGRQYAKH